MTDTTAPLPSAPRRRGLADATELLASMRFAIALLAVICIASMIGTVVRQGEPLNNYINEFGPFWAEVFRAAGLFSIYSSPWFLAILGFLVVSTSLCIARNAPKFIADMRTMKEDLREGAMRAFHHRGEARLPGSLAAQEARVSGLMQAQGWELRTDRRANGVMVAARKGKTNRLGYIAAHGSIVLICLGGLSDGDLIVRAQMLLTGKSVWDGRSPMGDDVSPHRLSESNPTFRGNLLVPEGQSNGTAVLNLTDGVVLQPLPFDVELKQFKVEYYDTGMPKLFASDIVIRDRDTGHVEAATVKVNQPVFHRGVAIYQSSFEDGGSKVVLNARPLRPGIAPFSIQGRVGESAPLTGRTGESGPALTLEVAALKPINVEDLGGSAAAQAEAAASAASAGLAGTLSSHLGSGARTDGSKKLHNVGPSITYRLRDAAGQAREFHNYMQPMVLDGQRVFLLGVREAADDSFRYLRLPVDEHDSIEGFLRLQAALQNRELRAAAALAYARSATPADRPAMAEQLRNTATRMLGLFAGAEAVVEGSAAAAGGLEAVSQSIEKAVPEADRPRVARMLLRILAGSLFELNNIAREREHLEALPAGEVTEAFMSQSVRSLSDSFYYPAPFILQLDAFTQVQASVFQVARAPGKKLVYLGAILLIVGVFAMLYVRERRVWVWLSPAPAGNDGDAGTDTAADAGAEPPATQVMVALSTARRTLDIDQEFDQLKAALLQGPSA